MLSHLLGLLALAEQRYQPPSVWLGDAPHAGPGNTCVEGCSVKAARSVLHCVRQGAVSLVSGAVQKGHLFLKAGSKLRHTLVEQSGG